MENERTDTAVKENVTAGETKQYNWEEAFEDECSVAPLIDICETTDNYELIANMPGVKKENVKIKFEDGDLVIMGRINYEAALQKKYIINETGIGNYYRKFRVSESIDFSKIEASMENGQLFITLPKHERVKPKTIEIK